MTQFQWFKVGPDLYRTRINGREYQVNRRRIQRDRGVKMTFFVPLAMPELTGGDTVTLGYFRTALQAQRVAEQWAFSKEV